MTPDIARVILTAHTNTVRASGPSDVEQAAFERRLQMLRSRGFVFRRPGSVQTSMSPA